VIIVKIIGISLLILGAVMGLSFGIDLYMGMSLQDSFRNAASMIVVMEPVEYTVFYCLILYVLGKNFYMGFKRRKQGKTRG
jgi:hypothetical protein